MRKNYVKAAMSLVLLTLFSFSNLFAQNVSGVVIDESGIPLPGASVLVVGTTNGTTTDFDGNYSIDISEDQLTNGQFTLSVSFMGYVNLDRTFSSGSDQKWSPQLQPDAAVLADVVVIGYGTVKKEDATGSVSAISSKDFNAGAIASPQDLMVGKTAGVQITSSGGAPGAGSTIRIRGGSSMNASNDPLIVIDGVPIDTEGVAGMQNPLNTVNPNDIETFTVLKDASATAIYGSRASNGVIIITTKQGSRGGKIKLNYTGNVSVATPAKVLELMDASQYKDFIKGFYGDGSDADIRANDYPDVNTDWQDEVYRTAISTDHNISMTGGLEAMPYRLSLGYTAQQGIVKTSDMNRLTVGLNLTPSFFDDHLKLSVNTKYMNVKNGFGNEAAIWSASRFDPTKPVNEDKFSNYGGYYTWVDASGNPVPIATMNPAAQLNLHDNSSTVNRYILNAKLDYKFHFAPAFTATLNLGLDGSDSDGLTVVQPTAAWARPTEGERAGEYAPYSQTKTNKTLDMYLSYNEDFDKHNVKVMGGYSWQHFYREGENETKSYSQTEEITPYRAYEAQNYLVSFFGRAEYNYNSKYLINATVRADGTSRFSEDNRWGIFPAIGLAWRINNEDFLKDSESLNNLKIRLGWGITGQQGVTADLPYQGPYVESNNTAMYPWGGGYINTLRPDGYDENIKWEETTTYNFGVDYGFLNDKVSGSLELYYRETKDLLNTIPVPAGANLTNLLLTNVGSLQNSGMEFNISWRAIVTDDFFWEIGGNVTYNINQITQLSHNDDPSFLGNQTGGIAGGTGSTIQINSVGYPTNSFFVYEQVYDAGGNPLEGVYVDHDGNGVYNDNDKIRIGQSAPTTLLGINTRIEYKNWDFSLSGRAQLGGTVYNNNKSNIGVKQDTYNSGGNYLSNRLPSAATGFNSYQFWSSYYLEDASFFRMDNMSVGYRFDNISGGDISLKINLTAQNIFVISGYGGVDPEVSSGIDNNFYPRPRTFMLGVNLGF
ncbi:MAG: TonB-dependent receptor [Flavobacteriales bacterium]|nr:TonB-dependent receptor [Flavobacteriales bacterium]